MDLLQVQEELNIVIQITQQQIDLINSVREVWDKMSDPSVRSRAQSHVSTAANRVSSSYVLTHPSRSTFRQLSSSTLKDPMAQLVENLKREFDDLTELRDNSNNLVNRTIQLVNIRLEDHGKAILVFTIGKCTCTSYIIHAFNDLDSHHHISALVFCQFVLWYEYI
jgi:hypothetical protein